MKRNTRKGHGGRTAGGRAVSDPSTGSGRLAARVRVLCVVICCALALQPSLIAPGRGHARGATRAKSAVVENSVSALAARSVTAVATAVAGGLGMFARATEAAHRAAASAEPAFEPEPAAAAVVFLGAPTGLSVVSTSDSQVILSWPAVVGAASYRVERSPNVLSPYTSIGLPVANGFQDTGVSRGSTYLYRVRVIDNQGALSPPGPVAMATAITFQDSELIAVNDPQGRQATVVKAVHVNDLRLAVGGVRRAGGLPATVWQESVLAGVPIRAAHVNELRAGLDEGRAALGLPTPAYTDVTLHTGPNGTRVKKVHFEELRSRSTGGTGVTGSGLTAYDFASARLDSSNRTGSGGVDSLSRNFNWSLPVVSLPGRAGLDLGLSLSYNSSVWTRSGDYVLFDGDWGWPAPGFRLGFPVVQGKFYDAQAQKAAYLMVTPSGARVSLRQTATPTVYEAADSSYLQLTENADGSLTLVAPGGTRMSYWLLGGAYKCTEVKDRNGNYITAAYNGYGNLETITDTTGRVLTFDYHLDGYLKEITQTWHREYESDATTEVSTEKYYWARFEYEDRAVATNFPGLTVFGPANGQTIHALKRVKLADDSYFTFDYTTWGQINKVSSHAPNNGLLNHVSLDLPANAAQPQADCPRPTERREWAAYWNGDEDGVDAAAEEAVTSYTVTTGAAWQNPETGAQETGTLAQQTTPDGAIYKEFSHASGWDKGLPRFSEVWGDGARQKWASTKWTQDDENLVYEQNPRVSETNVYDPKPDGSVLNRRRTEVSYTSFGLPVDVKEYDATATTVLRRTHTEYVPASVNANGAYMARRIIGLPEKREVYGLDGGVEKLFSKVTHEYDLGGEFLGLPEGNPASVVQHDAAYLGVGLNVRGNLSRVRRWDVTAPENQSQSVTSETGYNTLGSAVFTRDALLHKTVISYEDSDGGARLAYATKVTDPELYSSTAEYDYDTGVVRRVVDPRGSAVRTFYDAAGRRLKMKAEANGAYAKWEYGASGLYAKQLTKVDTNKAETFVLSVTDGAGRGRGTLREMPDVTGTYSAQRFSYDNVGRSVRAYNPVRVTADANDLSNVGAWLPAGEDAPANGGTGWVYKQREYDWKGRVRREVEADGTTDRLVDYEGCGCAGGEVVTVMGELVTTNDANAPSEARRTQKVYHDVLGRVVKRELLNWGGSVYSTTATLYDALGRAVRVRQYAGELTGDEPVADGEGFQTTRLEYDGHGRVKSRHLPGQNAGAATAYVYYSDDTVRSVIDARGVKTEYEYNDRHLVKKIRYNVLGVASVATDRPQGTTPIAPAPDVTYTYDAAGNRLTMATEQGLGGSVTYHYDALSRLDWEERTLPGLSGVKKLSYEYTLSGALKELKDEDGGKTYTYDYDDVGQMAAVKGTGFGTAEKTFAASAGYRAWGAPKGVSYGNQTGATFAYNSRGLMTQYRVTGLTQDGQYGAPQHGSDFEYYADGQVKYASDLFTGSLTFGAHRLHDRAYSYDQAGRLREAYSGYEANQFRTGTGAGVEGAFRQSYAYNAWGDMTGRTGRFWTQDDDTSDEYAPTGRNPAWEYDPDGRLVSRNEAAPDEHTYAPLRVSYDAAGRPHQTTQTTSAPRPLHPDIFDATQTVLTKTYDGDGVVVGEEKGVVTTFYLRSAALGGQAVAEYGASGARLVSHVVAGGGEVARQDGTALFWKHPNPVTGDELETDAAGAVSGKAVLDPEGVALGDADPFAPPAGGGGVEGMTQAQMNSRYAQLLPASLGGGSAGAQRCRLNGFELGCGAISSLLAGGLLTQGAERNYRPVHNRNGRYVGFVHWDNNAHAAGVGINGAGAVVRNSPNAGWLWMGLSFSSAGGGEVTGAGMSPLTLAEMRFEPGLYLLDGGGESQEPSKPSFEARNDCQGFADIVENIANSVNVHLARPDDLSGTVQRFMDALATRFTELKGASYTGAALRELGSRNEHFNSREFGSRGFAARYFEPDEVTRSGRRVPSNQVRHTVGGLIAGYVRGESAGLEMMNGNENRNDPHHGVPDINLNNQTVPMGARIAGPQGASSAAALATWIRETLCAK